MDTQKNFEIALVGQGNEGKTTLLKHFPHKVIINKNKDFDQLIFLKFSTNYGIINLNCYVGNFLEDKYSSFCQGVIFAHDISRNDSTILNLAEKCKLPKVLCGMKSDLLTFPNDFVGFVDVKIPHCLVSSKNNINCLEPFTLILRQLTGNNNFNIISVN